MASEVDICNLALAQLGDEAIVSSLSPPDGSAQAQHCATFYPMARNSLQDRHNWGFCTSREALARLDITPVFGWSYAYAVPSDVVSLLTIHVTDATDDTDPQPYELEQTDEGVDVIYCNLESANLRYVRYVTDPSTFSPLFTEALVWYLASFLAGPLIKGRAGAAESTRCFQRFKEVENQAIASDAVQHKALVRDTRKVVSWIGVR